VKYKRSEPIQHKKKWDSQKEWREFEQPFTEFEPCIKDFWRSSVLQHTWTDDWQSTQMRLCIKNQQPNWVIVQFDHGSGYEHHQQNQALCHHPKTSPLLVMYVHHSPVFDSSGKKASHTTDVRTYWADDSDKHVAKKNCHYLYSAMAELHEAYIGTVLKAEDEPEIHGWADGCGEQNKGRRTFRMLTEYAAQFKMKVFLNFACSSHFGGSWDPEGGRQCRACFKCEKRADTDHPVTGQPLGRILPEARDCVDYLRESFSQTRTQTSGEEAECHRAAVAHAVEQQTKLESPWPLQPLMDPAEQRLQATTRYPPRYSSSGNHTQQLLVREGQASQLKEKHRPLPLPRPVQLQQHKVAAGGGAAAANSQLQLPVVGVISKPTDTKWVPPLSSYTNTTSSHCQRPYGVAPAAEESKWAHLASVQQAQAEGINWAPLPKGKAADLLRPSAASVHRSKAAGSESKTNFYEINGRRHFICFDEHSPISKMGEMEAKAVPGTMSHYCFAAVSCQPGKLLLRRFSCYCVNCSAKKYRACVFLDTIRTKHGALIPKAFTDAHKMYREQGWAPYEMVLVEDSTRRETRSISTETRKIFGSSLEPGACFPVYCGGVGEVDHSFFWMAQARPMNRQSNQVVFKAAASNPNWDIKKGDEVLNITWRLSEWMLSSTPGSFALA
jgi:hypothetical protein